MVEVVSLVEIVLLVSEEALEDVTGELELSSLSDGFEDEEDAIRRNVKINAPAIDNTDITSALAIKKIRSVRTERITYRLVAC